MGGFEGRVCLVTGGANGIGRGVVRAFADAGARVAFCDLDSAGGEALAAELAAASGSPGGSGSGGGVIFRRVDVKDAGELTGFIDEVWRAWGGIDIVVNNVGISEFSRLAETPVEQFDRILATNLRPVFITSHELARRRKEAASGGDGSAKKYGRIINIASTRWLQSEPGSEGYAASKGAIVSLTHALAASFAGSGVTVNCISPGWIDTRGGGQSWPGREGGGGTGEGGDITTGDHAQHFSGRVGVVGDVARACLFLAAEENDFIDGQNLVIDGGMTKKMIYI